MANNSDKPLFHLDIHGCIDWKDQSDIQLGVEPFKFWFTRTDPHLISPLITEFQKRLDPVFTNIKGKFGHKVFFNDDCRLHGMWGDPYSHTKCVYTMAM